MSRKKQTVYTPDFKAKIALAAIREDKTLSQLSSDYDMHVNNVINWKKEVLDNLPEIFNRGKQEKAYKSELKKKEAEIEELYKQIGQLTTEVNWMKKKCREVGL